MTHRNRNVAETATGVQARCTHHYKIHTLVICVIRQL